MKGIKLKRLLIELPEKDHRTIKKVAANMGISLRKLVINALGLYLKTISKGDHGTNEPFT